MHTSISYTGLLDLHFPSKMSSIPTGRAPNTANQSVDETVRNVSGVGVNLNSVDKKNQNPKVKNGFKAGVSSFFKSGWRKFKKIGRKSDRNNDARVCPVEIQEETTQPKPFVPSFTQAVPPPKPRLHTLVPPVRVESVVIEKIQNKDEEFNHAPSFTQAVPPPKPPRLCTWVPPIQVESAIKLASHTTECQSSLKPHDQNNNPSRFPIPARKIALPKRPDLYSKIHEEMRLALGSSPKTYYKFVVEQIKTMNEEVAIEPGSLTTECPPTDETHRQSNNVSQYQSPGRKVASPKRTGPNSKMDEEIHSAVASSTKAYYKCVIEQIKTLNVKVNSGTAE